MPRISGHIFFACGLLHIGIGIATLREPMGAIARAGFLNAVEPHYDRRAAFWFFFAGALMLLLGQVYIWIERTLGRRVPAFLGWQMFAIAAAGAALIPTAGFWLVIPLGIYIVIAARREASR
ncbi:MAG: DUF6463 family protein [Bryobacteraceae bacterium]